MTDRITGVTLGTHYILHLLLCYWRRFVCMFCCSLCSWDAVSLLGIIHGVLLSPRTTYNVSLTDWWLCLYECKIPYLVPSARLSFGQQMCRLSSLSLFIVIFASKRRVVSLASDWCVGCKRREYHLLAASHIYNKDNGARSQHNRIFINTRIMSHCVRLSPKVTTVTLYAGCSRLRLLVVMVYCLKLMLW